VSRRQVANQWGRAVLIHMPSSDEEDKTGFDLQLMVSRRSEKERLDFDVTSNCTLKL
jgi:hypothetical protein